jgi:hypothetical protein
MRRPCVERKKGLPRSAGTADPTTDHQPLSPTRANISNPIDETRSPNQDETRMTVGTSANRPSGFVIRH